MGEFEVLATDLNTALDTNIGSRLAAASYTAPDNATITAIAGYTDSIESRIPAALVGGRMDVSVGAMETDVLTASALATSAVSEIQSGLATLASIAALNNISAADVWSYVTRTLTSGGGGGATADEVWDHVKALTVPKFLGLK